MIVGILPLHCFGWVLVLPLKVIIRLARSYLEQSLEMWQELQDEGYLGWSLVSLGEVALLQGDHPRAQDLFEEAIPPLSEAADYPMLAIPLRRLGQLAMFQGDLPKAAALIKEKSTA